MQSRVSNFERRIENEIAEKEGLLQDIENKVSLKINPIQYHKKRIIYAKELTLSYPERKEPVINNLSFEINQGERVFLHGANGCGKSTLIKAILGAINSHILTLEGELQVGAGLVISYINQDTSFLKGNIHDFL